MAYADLNGCLIISASLCVLENPSVWFDLFDKLNGISLIGGK